MVKNQQIQTIMSLFIKSITELNSILNLLKFIKVLGSLMNSVILLLSESYADDTVFFLCSFPGSNYNLQISPELLTHFTRLTDTTY